MLTSTPSASGASRRLLLQVLLPLAKRCETVHVRAMRECTLACGIVLRLARPRLLRRGLEGAAVGEGEIPWQVADLVHHVEMSGRLLVGLAARQESDARHRAR